MEAKDYLKDIQDIKQMMSQSSRFMSLSGLSGVLAGVYSLIGAWLATKPSTLILLLAVPIEI